MLERKDYYEEDVPKTRSLLLALLLTMALPANASAACVTFSDIAESDACYESVMYLAEEGITNGTGAFATCLFL